MDYIPKLVIPPKADEKKSKNLAKISWHEAFDAEVSGTRNLKSSGYRKRIQRCYGELEGGDDLRVQDGAGIFQVATGRREELYEVRDGLFNFPTPVKFFKVICMEKSSCFRHSRVSGALRIPSKWARNLWMAWRCWRNFNNLRKLCSRRNRQKFRSGWSWRTTVRGNWRSQRIFRRIFGRNWRRSWLLRWKLAEWLRKSSERKRLWDCI